MYFSAKVIEGSINGNGLKIGIIVSRFNELITKKLLEGCLEALSRHSVNIASDVTVIWVPGAYEIPLLARTLCHSNSTNTINSNTNNSNNSNNSSNSTNGKSKPAFDAVICLGAVIKGQTAHFDYVAGGAASGVMNAQMESGVPCIFGVLTTDTLEQCFDRAGGKAGNKGYEAAVTAIETANVIKQFKSSVNLSSKL